MGGLFLVGGLFLGAGHISEGGHIAWEVFFWDYFWEGVISERAVFYA